ncbi:MAG: type I DNA topoisomerase, partial [Chloroflexota bacterium]
MTFYEITPSAVRAAIENPRQIDQLLVDAQQARRILDRLVGYGVSPLLWKKVKRGLSAGRVQTVALRIVCEREREVLAFEPQEYWTIDADLAKQHAVDASKVQFQATLKKLEGKEVERTIGNKSQADQIVVALNGALYRVVAVTTSEKRRYASPPFTTSTLQQEASRKLGFNVKRTMALAQQVYEGIILGPEGPQGLITYMRTDSTNVASVAQQAAAAVIAQRYGPEFVPDKPNHYTTKSKGAQEAHEAIRPTSPERTPEMVKPFLDPSQFKLYELIWKRFIASQMRPYVYDLTVADIAAGSAQEISSAATTPFLFRATGSVEKFAGFRKVYMEGHDEGDAADDSEDKALPKLTEGEMLDLRQLLPAQHFTEPPPRFTEASLVRELENNGIGRPSTYAPTINTL